MPVPAAHRRSDRALQRCGRADPEPEGKLGGACIRCTAVYCWACQKGSSCQGLGNVDFRFAENLESIGRGAFQRSNISQIDFRSEKLEEIPASVCEDCYNLERISIPDTVKKINQNAFRNTYKLDSVTVPLSSEWSDQLFSGVAGYAKQKVTVIANPVTKEKNIYHQQENAVDFNCVKNFRDMSITVTDELKDKNDETGDLLNNDSNEFVTVRKEDDSSGRYQAISMYGKKQGDAKVRVSGTIRLEGDIHSENNTTALNDARLVLQVSQLYNIHVAQNPISVLTLSAERLAQCVCYAGECDLSGVRF